MNGSLYIRAVGFAAPGMPDWNTAGAVLRGDTAYVPADLPPYQPQGLPPNERRRATSSVRQAFRAADDVMAAIPRVPDGVATVFASSDTDTEVIQRICSVLTESAQAVSPTDFHNSVHNAASGYWSIAAGMRGPSTSISACDSTFAAGLLEAAALVQVECRPTLLVAYDVPVPFPLREQRPITTAVSVALLLEPPPAEPAAPRLKLSLMPGTDASAMEHDGLEKLRGSNPAARALPLLRLLATNSSGVVLLDAGHGRLLRVELEA